jgi:hypothetical protein
VIAYEFFRMTGYLEGGGTLDGAALDSRHFPGAGGANLHSIGAGVVSLLALLLLISSFFAKIPGGVKWALIVFGFTVLQWAFAILAFIVSSLGFLHGINALALFGCAAMAAMRVRRATASINTSQERATAPVA